MESNLTKKSSGLGDSSLKKSSGPKDNRKDSGWSGKNSSGLGGKKSNTKKDGKKD
jgi:hypothetical protein